MSTNKVDSTVVIVFISKEPLKQCRFNNAMIHVVAQTINLSLHPCMVYIPA